MKRSWKALCLWIDLFVFSSMLEVKLVLTLAMGEEKRALILPVSMVNFSKISYHTRIGNPKTFCKNFPQIFQSIFNLFSNSMAFSGFS